MGKKRAKYVVRVETKNGSSACEVIMPLPKNEMKLCAKKEGFPSEAEANEWGRTEIVRLIAVKKAERAKRNEKRAITREFERRMDDYTFMQLALLMESETGRFRELARLRLSYRMDALWKSYAFERIVKHGSPEASGHASADEEVGKDWDCRFENAKSGKLDAICAILDEAAVNRARELMETSRRALHEGSPKAKKMVDLICAIPGDKIVLVSSPRASQKFDISSAGKIGYVNHHRNELLDVIDKSLESCGVVIIRQFLPGPGKEFDRANGKKVMIPWKAIIGIRLENGSMIPVSAEEMEICHITMPDGTISREEMVVYKDLSDYENEISGLL